MLLLQSIGAVTLLALSLWVIVLNWSVLARYLLFKQRSGSWMPLFGGLLGCSGILIAPWQFVDGYWWLPFILDWGSIPGLVFTMLYFALGKSRGDSNDITI